MIVQGVDLSALPEQFNDVKHGRILLMDGDGPCYRIAATVKRLDTAIRHYQMEVLKQAFMTKAQHVRVHLTAHDSDKAGRFRVKAIKPYQGQRKGKAKPALLEPLRQAIALRENWLDEFSVTLHRDIEADDGMMIEAYQHKENSVIWSDDKDLRMTPYPYYCMEKGEVMPGQPFGWISAKCTPSGTLKVIGQGPLFFWAQMLMGDQADHVQGILRLDGKLCGPAATLTALQPLQGTCINTVANFVISAYRDIDQNPLPEGTLLWLLRHPHDSFLNYLQELDLNTENRRFINECNDRDWRTAG